MAEITGEDLAELCQMLALKKQEHEAFLKKLKIEMRKPSYCGSTEDLQNCAKLKKQIKAMAQIRLSIARKIDKVGK